MRKNRFIDAVTKLMCVSLLLSITYIAGHAQTVPANKTNAAVQQPAAQPVDERALGAMQEELLRLLRVSPKLSTVVARDPSLLSDLEYVARNNPQLADFLRAHPEISRNPEYYLFTNIGDPSGRMEFALERKMWPDMARDQETGIPAGDLVPLIVFVCVVLALLWLIRMLMENWRWRRIFKLQTEVHGKLIEKFGTSQELLTYMNTEAGSRFLEVAPIPVNFGGGGPVPSPVARVLTPLQVGIVLSLMGGGFLFLRRSLESQTTPLLVFGTLALTLGIGFIISAGVTWALAEHLGMMPKGGQTDEPTNVINGRQ